MDLQEEAVRIQGNLQHHGQVLYALAGDHTGGKHQEIRFQFQVPVRYGVLDLDDQPVLVSSNLRLPVFVISDKYDPLVPGLIIVFIIYPLWIKEISFCRICMALLR